MKIIAEIKLSTSHNINIFQERSDFWRFDFVSRRWRPLKSKPGPGCLHSHCAVKFLSVMLLFGGEREGQTLNEMWRFHFGESINQMDMAALIALVYPILFICSH